MPQNMLKDSEREEWEKRGKNNKTDKRNRSILLP